MDKSVYICIVNVISIHMYIWNVIYVYIADIFKYISQ